MKKMTDEQREFVKLILKQHFSDRHKLAYLDWFSYFLDETSCGWTCQIAHIIGKGVYLVTRISQTNDYPFETEVMGFDASLVDGLKAKAPIFNKACERRYEEVFGKGNAV